VPDSPTPPQLGPSSEVENEKSQRKFGESALIVILTLALNAGGIFLSYHASQRSTDAAIRGIMDQIGSSRDDARREQKAKAYGDYFSQLNRGLITVDSKGLANHTQCPSIANRKSWHLFELRDPLTQVRIYGSPQARARAGKLYDEYQQFVGTASTKGCGSSTIGRLDRIAQAYADDRTELVRLMCVELAARPSKAAPDDCD
jgi:hypothetical protein